MTAGSVGFTMYGANATNYCDGAVNGAGDMNGDGYDDVLIGCHGANKAYVVFGKLTGFADIDFAGLSSDRRGFVFVGTAGSSFAEGQAP